MSDPIILCLETATDICSVALSRGNVILKELTLEEGQQHSSQLTILIDQCLADTEIRRHDLNAIAISNGPGSYTGLRVGASVAKGIAYALGLPLIAISTLQSLADPFRKNQETIISSIDARRMEAYVGFFAKGIEIAPVTNIIWTEERLLKLTDKYGPIIICGNGIAKAQSEMPIPSAISIQPSLCNADLLVRLAYEKFLTKDFVDLAYHTPFYYKSPNITVPKRAF